MKIRCALRKHFYSFILFILSTSFIACGMLEVGIERTHTPDHAAPATIVALITENARLAAQATALKATLAASSLPTATPTYTPTDTPTPVPTNTSVPTDTPTPIPLAEPFAAAYTDRLGRPAAEAITTDAAVQPFERGLMLWRADEQAIYVLPTDGTWARYADTWDETQPLDDPSLMPPERLLQPVRGFGKVWREQLGGPQTGVGWALERERGYEMLAQPFDGGQMLTGAKEGEVFVLYADGTWESKGVSSP